MARFEVSGTELTEIRDAENAFSELIERELRAVARRATAVLGEVIVARAEPTAANPDDLNGITLDWRTRLSSAIMPWLERFINAIISAQITAVNFVLGRPIITRFDEQLVTQLLLEGAENRLVRIGDQLWENARSALAEGVTQGESIPKLAARIRNSAGVTAPRATAIARTEVIGASNKSSLEVVRSSGLTARKRWIATFDDRVRLTHIAAHGQIVSLDEPFSVGGAALDHPGDFTGPAEEVINCRCALGYEIDDDDENGGGSVEESSLVAAAMQHDGAMIALVPTIEDAKRLALADGEPVDQLHMTMFYLGDAVNWSENARARLVEVLTQTQFETVQCRAFGLAHWNPNGEDPCWVLNVGDDTAGYDGIAGTRSSIDAALSSLGSEIQAPDVPDQHTPFAAHVCLAYTSDTSQKLINTILKRIGPVTFDRIRVAFAGEHADIPLNGTLAIERSAAPAEGDVDWFIEKDNEACSDERPWAVVKVVDGSVEGCHETREDAVAQLRALLEAQARERDGTDEAASLRLAVQARSFQEKCPPGQHRMPDGSCMPDEDMALFEGIAVIEGAWTGDGRQFAPDSLTWEDLGEVNVPLQWQKETSHGGMNDVTVNVGRLTKLERSGSEILVAGYIDAGSDDGAEVVRRLKSDTLGGVSIVADDPEQADVEFVYPDACGEINEMTPEEISQDVPIEDLEACFWPTGMIFHSGRIRALTLVDTPAFVEASIKLIEADLPDDAALGASVISQAYGVVNARSVDRLNDTNVGGDVKTHAQMIDELEPIIAAAHTITIPDLPPAEYFDEPPELPPFGALTVTDDGRIYGLIAPKDVAHRSYPDKRVVVPLKNVDYSRWMNRETIVAGGQRIRTGVITMECGHASTDPRLHPQAAMAHYENSCSVVATGRIGVSKRYGGLWFSGVLLKDVTPAQVTRILACQFSGDWRAHREKPGWRDFVAALLVPAPGFATSSRASVQLNNGALVASTVPINFVARDTIVASVIGSTDLPIADRDREWDGSAAQDRVFEMCTDGDTVNVDCVSRAFLWRDPDTNPQTQGAYKLGFADVIDGRLQIIPRGVAATAGGRGVDSTVDISAEDKNRIKSRICTLYDAIRERFDDWPECPFERDSESSTESDADADADIELSVASSVDEVFAIPSWDDVQRKREMRVQALELAEQLQHQYGIEIGV